MDTSILHKRILEYKAKANHPTSKEMILLFESWFTAIENYLADMEMDYYVAQNKISRLEAIISQLCDVIILTGHSDKIESIKNEDPDIKKAIELLLKSKDRKNLSSVVAIAGLLSLYPGVDFKNIKQLKDHVTRE
jgi:hypothetical protein